MKEWEILQSVRRMAMEQRKFFWSAVKEIAYKRIDESDLPKDFIKTICSYELISWLEPGDLTDCWQKTVDSLKPKKRDENDRSETSEKKGDENAIQH